MALDLRSQFTVFYNGVIYTDNPIQLAGLPPPPLPGFIALEAATDDGLIQLEVGSGGGFFIQE